MSVSSLLTIRQPRQQAVTVTHLSIALMAECSALVLDEAQVCQLLVTHLATETLRVPGLTQGLDGVLEMIKRLTE